uniref:TATA-box binding n=2 Tax=Paenibacillus athensensis TaxID=1967502 RepID=A0A4Y8PSB7_9BACL
MIGMAVISWIFGWVRHAEASAGNDAERLLNAVKPFVQSETRIEFKYTASYGDCQSGDQALLATGRELSGRLGLGQAAKLGVSNDHSVYTSENRVFDGGTATLTAAHPQGQAACYMVLRLDASAQVAQTDLLDWQTRMSGLLEELNLDGAWNIMVQGEAVVDPRLGEVQAKQVTAGLLGTLDAAALESYADTGTWSVSAITAQLAGGVMSGDHRMNLQAAMHRDSVSGKWRLTVGTPIVTMEY